MCARHYAIDSVTGSLLPEVLTLGALLVPLDEMLVHGRDTHKHFVVSTVHVRETLCYRQCHRKFVTGSFNRKLLTIEPPTPE